MIKIKTLPLDSVLRMMSRSTRFEDELARLPSISPRVGRPGRYLERLPRDRKQRQRVVEWFELPDGRAFVVPENEQLLAFTLERLETERLTPEDVAGLEAICKSRLATKEQRRLLYMYRHSQHLRQIRFSARRSNLRFSRDEP